MNYRSTAHASSYTKDIFSELPYNAQDTILNTYFDTCIPVFNRTTNILRKEHLARKINLLTNLEIKHVIVQWIDHDTHKQELYNVITFKRDKDAIRNVIQQIFVERFPAENIIHYVNRIHVINIVDDTISVFDKLSFLTCAITNTGVTNDKKIISTHNKNTMSSVLAFNALYITILVHIIPHNRFSTLELIYNCVQHQLNNFYVSAKDWFIIQFIQKVQIRIIIQTRIQESITESNAPIIPLFQMTKFTNNNRFTRFDYNKRSQ